MSMTEEEKELAAERRAAERLEEALDRERAQQAEIANLEIAPEALRAVTYLNRQLLRRERSEDWAFLRATRAIHLRQGTKR